MLIERKVQKHKRNIGMLLWGSILFFCCCLAVAGCENNESKDVSFEETQQEEKEIKVEKTETKKPITKQKKLIKYQFFTPEGELQMSVTFDEETLAGMGIRYYPGSEREAQLFIFDNKKDEYWYEWYDKDYVLGRAQKNPYSLLSDNGDSGEFSDIKNYKADSVFLEDGRPDYFCSTGWITYIYEEEQIEKLLEIDFTYREDGSLIKREYWHNDFVFGTWYSTVDSYYDERERLLYEDCYITHGSLDYYYIYEEDETVPSYCLALDHNLSELYAELYPNKS